MLQNKQKNVEKGPKLVWQCRNFRKNT